jgi:hypothetical protein
MTARQNQLSRMFCFLDRETKPMICVCLRSQEQDMNMYTTVAVASEITNLHLIHNITPHYDCVCLRLQEQDLNSVSDNMTARQQ